ncbi:MAG: response regulator [Nitrosopumilus sp.]|nr:MAG: response regulator [Nitrosopumilus sp.]
MKILIIEDNSSISSMLVKYLNKKNFDAMDTNNARNGLELIQKNNFDVVILDLNMPKFSGWDFLKKINSDGLVLKSKIIVLTASVITSEQEMELEQLGINLLLKKPIDPDDLIAKIHDTKELK